MVMLQEDAARKELFSPFTPEQNIGMPDNDGVQGRLPQNVHCGNLGYLKLKTVKAQQTQEELFTSHFTAWKKLD